MPKAFDITPAASDEFNTYLAGLDVCMPLRRCSENVGTVLDADGRDVITIDVNSERSDEEADAIARLVAVTLNRFGGFEAEPEAESHG